jgi:chaperonin GroEL
MKKKVVKKEEARKGLKKGLDTLSDAVKVTLGAKGNNVAFNGAKFGEPIVTKDGVSVAREIYLEDPLEDMGAQMVKGVSLRVNDLAGDGTTTATVLAQAIVKEGMKYIKKGVNPIDIKRGIDSATKDVITFLNDIATPVKVGSDYLKDVAYISTNNDKDLGDSISECFKVVGKNGTVKFDKSYSEESSVEVEEGFIFESGYVTPAFVSDERRMLFEVKDYQAYVVLINANLDTLNNEIKKLLKELINTSKPFIVVAESFSTEVINMLVGAKTQVDSKVCLVKSSSFGDRKVNILKDLAIYTGGLVLGGINGDKKLDADDLTLSDLGSFKDVIVSEDRTVFSKGGGSEVEITERVEQIKNKLAKAIEDKEPDYTVEYLEKRVSNLTGKLATLKVGSTSPLELKEKMDRVEDAMNAVRAAIEEGVLSGGGVALIKAMLYLKDLEEFSTDTSDEEFGRKALRKALKYPLKQIVENSGDSVSSIVDHVVGQNSEDFFETNIGYDVKGGAYTDMIKGGIIDPKKVTRVALESASSIAGTILTIGAVLVDVPDVQVSTGSENTIPPFMG